VPIPWDPKHICYVWFDALTNYVAAAGYASDPDRFARVWPANIHLIGKDILRFHAIYWPAMLMAGGIEPPMQVWAHGFLTVGGKKMSKTNLTGIHPFELLDQFGIDSYRYYFMREMRFGEDGNFSFESMVERHNADLANGLGNLASRVLAMLGSYFDGTVPAPVVEGAESDLPSVVADAVARYDEHMLAVHLQPALIAVWDIVDRANHYLVETEPWKLAKDEGKREELASVLYASAETLRILAVLISPIMPAAAGRLWSQLGQTASLEGQRVPTSVEWGGLEVGTSTTKGESLFPRLDAD
jgi:methionyl-tRNA synthetase